MICSFGCNYRKIPKISPGVSIFRRPFLGGLFLEWLIFGEAYVRRESCISKSIKLALFLVGSLPFFFVLLCIWGQFPSTSPLGGLYLEGLIFGILCCVCCRLINFAVHRILEPYLEWQVWKGKRQGKRERENFFHLLSPPSPPSFFFPFHFSLFRFHYPSGTISNWSVRITELYPIIKSNSRNVIKTFKTDLSPFFIDFKK